MDDDELEARGTEVALEVRSAPEGDLELRELEDGHFHFSGYAAVFDAPSDPMPFVETIRPGAFTRTLRQAREIPLLINHDRGRLPLAVTPKTLRLTEDDRGLRVEADIPPTSDARDLAMHAAAGNVRHMSFAFKPTPAGEKWSDDGRRRDLLEVRLAEASVLIGNPPAYRQTTAYIRSLAHRLDVEPDGLTVAIGGLEEGRPLTDEEARLLEAAIAELRLAERRSVPPSIRLRRMALEAARRD